MIVDRDVLSSGLLCPVYCLASSIVETVLIQISGDYHYMPDMCLVDGRQVWVS